VFIQTEGLSGRVLDGYKFLSFLSFVWGQIGALFSTESELLRMCCVGAIIWKS